MTQINALTETIQSLGRMGILLLLMVKKMFSGKMTVESVLKQIHFIGVRSMVVVSMAGLFVGMVIALLFHDTLVRFGAVSMAGSAVGLSLIWELGPVLTALIIIGRAGSATCAEISIMRAEQQIDALECMAIDPVRFLLSPRLLAGVISIPLLSALFIVVGIFGGYFVSVVLFQLSSGVYFQGMNDTVLWRDLSLCFTKSITFSVLILWIVCSKVYYMHLNSDAHGSEGVSYVTTAAVVHSSITVLFADYIISALLL